MKKLATTRLLSSVPLQVLLYFGWHFVIVWWLLELFCFIYKGNILEYSDSALGTEIALLFVFAGLETVRYLMGYKGNLTERKFAMAMFMVLSAPVILAYCFFLLWQTYVLRLEVILNYIGLVISGIQFILGGFTLFTFIRNTPFS
eukprot:Nk52_evm10s539 gene=Nk52_evmTU10s539